MSLFLYFSLNFSFFLLCIYLFSASGVLDLLAGSFLLTCLYIFMNVLTWEQVFVVVVVVVVIQLLF